MKPAALLMLVVLLPAIARAASLEVTVHGVRDSRGTIRIGVCARREFLSYHCAYNAVVPAHAGDVSARIDGIAPGSYAVAAFQDLDRSGKLKRNLFGLPREDLGFSRDPSLRFGPPAFARSAITIGPAGSHIALTMHRFGP